MVILGYVTFPCPLFYVLFFIEIGDKQKREVITYLSYS